MLPIGRVCSSIMQSLVKLQDPGDFSIPCCIGDMQIEGALCDLGASVSLMPFSLYWRLQLVDLTPTTISIQLADCSIRQPIGILEDVPIRVGEFLIPCDFFIMNIGESLHVPLILGRPFLATAGAKIDVQAGTLSFRICGKKVDFCFPPSIPSPAPTISPPPLAPVPVAPPIVFTSIKVFDGGGGLDMWPTRYDDLVPIPTRLGITSVSTEEVVNSTPTFYTFPNSPPELPPFTIWR